MILIAAQVSGHLGGASDADLPIGRIIVAFILCLAIAGLAILLLRRRLGGQHDLKNWLQRVGPKTGATEIVEVRRVNPHVDLGVVRYDDIEFLILLHAQRPFVLRERAIAPAPGDKCEG